MSTDAFDKVLANTQTLTFDCYGTLVDWRAGLTGAFRGLFGSLPSDQIDKLFAAYLDIEALIESGPYRSYREVLSRALAELSWQFDLAVPPDLGDALADSLCDWPIFPDAARALRRLQRRYRLGVLSNIDRDLFDETQRRLGVTFDFVVTAEDVRSYKPAHGHFCSVESGLARYADLPTVLHVAQSLFHDGTPANELGLAYIWINRYKQENSTDVTPLATFTDLASLVDVLESSRSGSARR